MPPKVKEVESSDPSQPDEYTEYVRRAIAEGMADCDAGRVMSTEALKKSLEREFGPIRWR